MRFTDRTISGDWMSAGEMATAMHGFVAERSAEDLRDLAMELLMLFYAEEDGNKLCFNPDKEWTVETVELACDALLRNVGRPEVEGGEEDEEGEG